jgi:hypothetical protein
MVLRSIPVISNANANASHWRANDLDVPLLLQIFADSFGDTCFRDIGWRDSYCSNEAGIQVMKHMAFVSIHTHAAALPSMPHLPIFDADASVFGDSLDQTRFPLLIDLHILLFDQLRNREGGLSQFRLFLLQGLNPGFYRKPRQG